MFSPQAYLIFNMRKPPFDNLKVRQAVMAAMNRNMVVNNIFFGLGKVATSPFVTTEMFYDKNMPAMPFDMKQARALIKESGIKPGDYTIRQLSFPYGSTWDRLAEYTKQALEQLGFKVNLESTDAGGWASRTGNWDFDLTTNFTYQYGDPALGVQRLYISSNIVKGSPFANVQGYSNPETDKQWGSRRLGDRSGQAPGAVQPAADHAGQGSGQRFPGGHGVPHAVPRQREEPGQDRHRPERVVRRRLHREISPEASVLGAAARAAAPRRPVRPRRTRA